MKILFLIIGIVLIILSLYLLCNNYFLLAIWIGYSGAVIFGNSLGNILF